MKGKELNILLIGASKTGKTHFGGQIYGRLKYSDGDYTIKSPPDDIKIFEEVLEKLASGLSADHTHFTFSKTLTLSVTSRKQENINVSIPDYGGEQITQIVSERKLDENWRRQILDSNCWILFIRPSLISTIEDIINKTIQEPSELNEQITEKSLKSLSQPSFYIELVQMLLNSKGKSILSEIKEPKLLVLLSCWDEIISADNSRIPDDLLKKILPLFHSFIHSNWSNKAIEVIGLSSLGKSLNMQTPDTEYQSLTPESFGYLILPSGQRDPDLTKIFSLLQTS